MTTYIQGVNAILAGEIAKIPGGVVYGENITNGSFISGMTKNLKVDAGGAILNVGNCENAQAGIGFGLMMSGVPAVMFSKQLEFTLLGMDHFVNTHQFANARLRREGYAGFAVVTILCDQGLQGPQSSYNGLADMCSTAKCPGYVVTNRRDAEHVFSTQLSRPGFKIICLSQRLWGTELLDPGLVWAADDGSLFQYTQGADATVLCFNAALPYGWELRGALAAMGKDAALFSANVALDYDLAPLLVSAEKTGRLVLIDDSKSTNLPLHRIAREIAEHVPRCALHVVTRESNPDAGVGPDRLAIDIPALARQLAS